MNLEAQVNRATITSDFASHLTLDEINLVAKHAGEVIKIPEEKLIDTAHQLDSLVNDPENTIAKSVITKHGLLVKKYIQNLLILRCNGLNNQDATEQSKKQLRAMIASRRIRLEVAEDLSRNPTSPQNQAINRIELMTGLCQDIFYFIDPVIYPKTTAIKLAQFDLSRFN